MKTEVVAQDTGRLHTKRREGKLVTVTVTEDIDISINWCPNCVRTRKDITQVDVEDVERWFKVDRSRLKYNRRLHKWFVHMTPMVVFIKLGLLKTRLTVDEYAEVVIPIEHY